MNPVEVREMLERVGAITTGHFKLSSGRHADTYVQKQRVFEHPRLTASLGDAIAQRMRAAGRAFNVVVSPAVGALTLGHEVARAANCRFQFAERVDDEMTLRRGQHIDGADHVLVVEDVITTGGSAADVVRMVESTGAHLAGVAALVDRSEGDLSFPLDPLLRLKIPSWEPENCPLCAKGDPLDAPGSRHVTS